MAISKKKIVGNIFFYLALVVIYALAIFGIINIFTGGVIYIGNSRYDVILTDSMSEKNSEYADFLEGTYQIDAFDLIRSTKINENTELNVKDIVLFKNPALENKTVAHRIVNIIEHGNKLTVNNANKVDYKNIETITLETDANIKMSVLDFTKITLEVYSPLNSGEFYVLGTGKNVNTFTSSVEQINDYYKHTLTYERSYTAPLKTTIVKTGDLESYISKVTYTSNTYGDIVFEAKDYAPNEEGVYEYMYNSYYLYEIRADKSSTSDGVFERDELIAKVTNKIPKMGYLVRFLSSLFGIIMFVGLSLVITVSSFLMNKPSKDKKESSLTQEQTDNNDDLRSKE